MSSPVTSEEIARYLDGVRAALADLPSEVRDDLLEDEPAHLAEVLAEGSGPLERRLGDPEAYAAELRTAAGLALPNAGRSVPTPSIALVRLRSGLRRADLAIGPIFGYDRAAELLRLLRPGWWVLRGYLVGLLILNGIAGGVYGLLPFFGSEAWAWFIVVGLCVVASVRLGRVMPRLRQWHRWAVVAGGVFVAFLALVSLNWRPQIYYDNTTNVYYDPYSGVSDVYPYDKDGRPLSDVQLFDQNKNPIQVGDPTRCLDKQDVIDDQQGSGSFGKADIYRYPLCPPDGWRPGEPAPTPAPSSSPAPSPGPTR
jgi:uncharacterized membrane protein